MKLKETIFWGLILLFTAATCGVGFYQYRAFYDDDAYISLRYCRNFINGDGLVWNPSERVEGYSNFLYVILVSLLGELGFALTIASRIVGIVSFAVLVVFAFLFLRKYHFAQTDIRFLLPVPVILIFTSFSIIIWSLGGLEGSFFTLLCTMGIWLFTETINGQNRYAITAGLFFALAGMARADGALFFLIACIYFLFLKLTGRKINPQYVVSFIGTFSIVFGTYLLWRLDYYGNLLPNTYYLQTCFDPEKLLRGIYYIVRFAISPPYTLFFLFAALVYSIVKLNWNEKMTYLLMNIAIYLSYVACLGGDHMPAHRFIIPIIPASALLLFFALRPLSEYMTLRRAAIINGLMLFLAMFQIVNPSYNMAKAKLLDSPAFLGTIVGKYIAEAWPSGSLVALNTAGSTPYFAPNHRYIDMLGINDTTIARREIKDKKTAWQKLSSHEKGDGEYVLSRKPDYIILGPAHGTTKENPYFLSDLEISQSQSFLENYILHQASIEVKNVPDYEKCGATCSGVMTFTYYQEANYTK